MAPHLRELGFDVKVVTTGLFGTLPDDHPNVIRTADLRSSRLLRAALRRPPVQQQAAAVSPAGCRSRWRRRGERCGQSTSTAS
jgi:hypothetical protein